MLIQFTVGNFRSFREPQTFSMVAAPIKARDDSIDEANTFRFGKASGRLLRCALIYGANASGKSNLVQAIRTMKNQVLGSQRLRRGPLLDIEPFRLTTDTVHEPSFFEAVFLLDGIETRYGFMATAEKVVGEWLFQRTTAKERRLFMRRNSEITIGEHFTEGVGLEPRTRPDALFLTVVAEFNGAVASGVARWFQDLTVRTSAFVPHQTHTIQAIESGPFRDGIIRLIQELDFGIADIRIDREESPPELFEEPESDSGTFRLPRRYRDRPQVRTLHRSYTGEGEPAGAVEFDFTHNESEGTKKVFALAGVFVQALQRGDVVVLDELDAQLHPHLTQALVGLFASPLTNPGNGQLIFTTHDTHLQDSRRLRRDQVWIAEKTRVGATKLRSLSEYHGVRNDASYEERYLQGLFGGIPQVGDPGAALSMVFERALLPKTDDELSQLSLDWSQRRLSVPRDEE